MAEYPALEDNEFITKAAEIAANLAAEDAYLSGMINRNALNDVLSGGGKGRSVDVKIPSALTARVRGLDSTDAIVLDALHETTKSITLGEHIYSAVGLTEGEMNLDVTSYAEQVLRPQVAAVVDRIEEEVQDALQAVAEDVELAAAYDKKDPLATITSIRRTLRTRGVPQAGMNLVVGTEVYADLLAQDVINFADASGATAALREGNVGKLRGFTVVESNRVEPTEIIAFHRDAFVLAVRAPLAPAGQKASVASEAGFSLRVLQDYDTMHTVHRSVVGTFAGVAAMPLYKVDRTSGTARIVETTPALRVDVASA